MGKEEKKRWNVMQNYKFEFNFNVDEYTKKKIKE